MQPMALMATMTLPVADIVALGQRFWIVVRFDRYRPHYQSRRSNQEKRLL